MSARRPALTNVEIGPLSLIAVSGSSNEGLGTLAETARLSRDFRPVLDDIQSSLRNVTDGEVVMDEWEAMVDSAAIDPVLLEQDPGSGVRP